MFSSAQIGLVEKMMGELDSAVVSLLENLDFKGSDEVATAVSEVNSKQFYLLQVVEELKLLLVRLNSDWACLRDDSSDSDNTKYLYAELRGEYQSFSRPMREILCDLILFSKTSDDAYFNHYLHIKSIERRRGGLEDLGTFFGLKKDKTADRRNRSLADAVSKLEAEVDGLLFDQAIKPSRVWYAQFKSDGTPRTKSSSHRDRLKRALKGCTQAERGALGNYLRFRIESMHVHRAPSIEKWLSRLEGDSPNIVDHLIDLLQVMSCIVIRCGKLAGGAETTEMKTLRTSINNPSFTETFVKILNPDINVGDYVIVRSCIAEVTEKTRSEYGYRSFKVRFIANSPDDENTEDWYPGYFTKLLIRKNERKHLDKVVKSTKTDPNFREAREGLTDREELLLALYNLTISRKPELDPTRVRDFLLHTLKEDADSINITAQ